MEHGARLCFVVTHPVTAKILLGRQLDFLKGRGFRVSVIASPGPMLDEVRDRHGVETIGVPMTRGTHFTEGPRALAAMARALRRLRPDIMNASTPKAALLGHTSARSLGVPRRIYLVRGSLLEVTHGAGYAAFALAEHVTMRCASEVVFVSESLRRLYVERGFGRAADARVIPSNGIDVTRFAARQSTTKDREATRARLGIPRDAVVVGFVGRLVADKGILDLAQAVTELRGRFPQLRLLLVGGDLAGDKLPDATTRALGGDWVVQTGVVADPAPYYAAMDLLAFPSYREGMPNVPLEAAATELPAVGYRVTGVRDAIVDGETGALVPLRDVAALTESVGRYLSDEGMRRAHGEAARRRVLAGFEQQGVWARWASLYEARANR